jgi:hypothetical protein
VLCKLLNLLDPRDGTEITGKGRQFQPFHGVPYADTPNDAPADGWLFMDSSGFSRMLSYQTLPIL